VKKSSASSGPEKVYLGNVLEPLNFFKDFQENQKHIEDMLCRYLNMKTLVAFIGSGASHPLGYPDWSNFALDILTLFKSLFHDQEKWNSLQTCEKNCLPYDNIGIKEAVAELVRSGITHLVNTNSSAAKRILSLKSDDKDLKVGEELFDEQSDLKAKFENFKFFLVEEFTLNREMVREIILQRENYIRNDHDISRLNRYLDHIACKRESDLSISVILSQCERLLFPSNLQRIPDGPNIFRALVKSYFRLKHEIAPAKTENDLTSKYRNIYPALLKLPIKRFVTLNYDVELERAILYKDSIRATPDGDERIKAITIDQIVADPDLKSFSQTKKYSGDLARFLIARYELNEHTVFHCHGRIDDIDSCIITEDDYQKWYLREEGEDFTSFRQTLDLVLDSTPILFIGFGLKDPDLMRILREINANSRLDTTRNPLFCLLFIGESDIPTDGTTSVGQGVDPRKALEDECTAFFVKYGVHVIPVYQGFKKKDEDEIDLYDRGDLRDSGAEKLTRDEIQVMSLKLLDLHSRWRKWQKGILQKPYFRRSHLHAHKKDCFHYRFERQHHEITAISESKFKELDFLLPEPSNGQAKPPGDQIKPEDRTLETNDQAPRTRDKKIKGFADHLVLILGEGGTGKSWSIQHYLEKRKEEGFKIFFWSSYYASDVIVGIERLIEYITEKPLNKDHDRFELFKKILHEHDDLMIVFDGIEKLLNPNNELTEGEAINSEVRNFFSVISSPTTNSRIILTTRLFPTDLLKHIREKLADEKKTEGRHELLDAEQRIRKERVIKSVRCESRDLEQDEVFKKVAKRNLSAICSLVEGNILAISLIRGILAKDVEAEKIIRDIENTPIDRRIQRVISEAIKNVDRNLKFSKNHCLAEKFVERIALFMHPVREEIAKTCLEDIRDDCSEATDIAVKSLLKELVDGSLVQEVTDEGEFYVVHPLVRSYVFEQLHRSLFVSLPSLQLSGFTSSKEIVDPGGDRGKRVSIGLFRRLCDEAWENTDNKIASDLCRAAYSILRARFCSNTVARWGNYDDYLKLVVRLYDTIKYVSPHLWDHIETPDPEKTGPLYGDELAWVYNEVGLVSYSMGNKLNATALWVQGSEINRLIDGNSDGRFMFQSCISLGGAYVQYGRLLIAKPYLDKAFEIAHNLKSQNLIHRVLAYVALVKYLQGSLEEADRDFTVAWDKLEHNPRARAIVSNFHGEVLLKLDRRDEAFRKIEQSRHIAEAAHYPDLIAYSRLSKANYLSGEEQYAEAQSEFQFVLKTAREKSLRRLEAATLSGMSRLAQILGDFQSSKHRAIESLKISNEYVLGLHQTVGMLVLGKALVSAGQEDTGIACLQTAREIAKTQGYFLRYNEADKELQKIRGDL
jgi:tetratricopeptide (TPR) repeat protein